MPKLKLNRSFMIGVLFGVFACVTGYFGAQLGMTVVGGNSTPDMDKAILDMANLMNTKLPIMIDNITRLDAVLPQPGNAFAYKVTILGDTSEGLMQTDVDKLLSRIKNNICTSPPLRLYVDRKTDISYTYYSGSGKYLGALTVRTRDC